MEHECDGLRDHMDEEVAAKDDLSRQLSKAQSDADHWRQKYEAEALGKAEELEMSKMKLQARLAEAQGTVENLQTKLHMIDKAKGKLQAEIEEAAVQLDQAQVHCSA